MTSRRRKELRKKRVMNPRKPRVSRSKEWKEQVGQESRLMSNAAEEQPKF